jgi:hypothetical protein
VGWKQKIKDFFIKPKTNTTPIMEHEQEANKLLEKYLHEKGKLAGKRKAAYRRGYAEGLGQTVRVIKPRKSDHYKPVDNRCGFDDLNRIKKIDLEELAWG